MLSILINGLSLAVISGIIGTIYTGVLPYEDFFSFWWKFGNRFEGKWFFRPFWVCAKCFSGQFAAWYYLIHCANIEKTESLPLFPMLPGFKINFAGYLFPEHLFSICAAIFAAIIFSNILNKITNE